MHNIFNGWRVFSVTFLSIFIFIQANAHAENVQRIGSTLLPQAFTQALEDGMNLPVFIHLINTQSSGQDIKAGKAFIWMDKGIIRVKRIQLESGDGGIMLDKQTLSLINDLNDVPFTQQLRIDINNYSHLELNIRRLLLQLVITREALGTEMITRSQDIGRSSTNWLSNSLTYTLGVSSSWMRRDAASSSSYVSLNNITSLREQHIDTDASLYNLGSGQQDAELHKVMYERDYAGHRFAGGMLDTWNLQSLGPVTALSAGKIYGLSWGNQASSTQFENVQSATPVVVFLPAAGEVHLSREGRLISVQNFNMGNYEVDTRSLPYGIYDVQIDVLVNGMIVSHSTQRINKLFGHGSGNPQQLSWQVWGGRYYKERWSDGLHTLPPKESWLAGGSVSGSLEQYGWSATAYSDADAITAETRAELPLPGSLTVSLQTMNSSDGSSGVISSLSTVLPGDFSSIWMSQEKTHAGSQLRRCSTDNRAIGSTVNLSSLQATLGSFSISYNDDLRYGSHYYNADYTQSLYAGPVGSLNVRVGVQRFSNGSSNSETGKFVALDFSLPMGSWFSAGVTNQNGYTIANASARKQFNEGIFRSAGVSLSRSVSGYSGDNKTLSGGGYTQFETPFSDGTVNVNSAASGYSNASVTAGGSIGWAHTDVGASGRSDGDAGILLKTDIDDDGNLSARINGQVFPLKGKHNFLSVPSYSRYDVELQNSQTSADSYDITTGRRSNVTLYPGNIFVIEPEVRQMVTVSGRVRNSQGEPVPDIFISNRLGGTRTDDEGEFVFDLDKKFPVIALSKGGRVLCSLSLPVSKARGAVWIGNISCEKGKHSL